MAVISRPVPNGWQIGRDALSKASPHGWFLDATLDEVYPRGVAASAIAVPALIPTSSNVFVDGAFCSAIAGNFAISGSPQPDGVAAVGEIGEWQVRIDCAQTMDAISGVISTSEPTVRRDFAGTMPGVQATGTLSTPSLGISTNPACAGATATGTTGVLGYGIGINVAAQGPASSCSANDLSPVIDCRRSLVGLRALCQIGAVLVAPDIDCVLDGLESLLVAGSPRIVLGEGVADGVASEAAVGLPNAISQYGIAGVDGSGLVGTLAVTLGIVLSPAAISAVGTAKSLQPTIFNRFLFPVYDVSDGQWRASVGDDLRAMLDEPAPDDGDYIYTTTAVSTCEVKLLPGADTRPHHDYVVRYRARGSLVVRLKCGSVTIASWREFLGNDYQSVIRVLTDQQMSAITDYSDLRLQFIVGI